jgi:hypothetical protein
MGVAALGDVGHQRQPSPGHAYVRGGVLDPQHVVASVAERVAQTADEQPAAGMQQTSMLVSSRRRRPGEGDQQRLFAPQPSHVPKNVPLAADGQV